LPPLVPAHTRSAGRPSRTLGRALVLAVAVAMLRGLVSGTPAVRAAESPLGDAAVAWPAAWSAYAFADGSMIADVDGDVGCGTGYCDVASGGGTRPSVYIASDGSNVFFRIRVGGDPDNPAAGGFLSTAYVIQIGVGGVTKAAVGLNGKSSSRDYVYVTDSGGAVVDEIYAFPFDASGGEVSAGARSLADGFGQYFVDYQIPIARITARSDGGVITASTPVQFFVGSSQAANLAIINKDFMTGTAVVYTGLGTMTLGAANFVAAKAKALVSGPNPPQVGVTTTYDLTVTAHDEGFNAISGAVGTDMLPAGVAIVSTTTAIGTISATGQVVTWSIGTMQPGVAYTATIRVSVTPANGDFGATLNLNPGMSFTGNDANTAAPASGTSNGVTAGPVAGNLFPTANDDAATATNGVAVVIDVLANDSDADGALVPGSQTITVAATKGSTSINLVNGRVTYTPNVGVTGTDTFTYQICDDGSPSHCDTAVVIVTLQNSPVATDDTVTATENTPAIYALLTNDSDPDGNLDATTVTVTSGPSHGGTTVNPVTGAVTYTPTAGYTGPDAFTYQVCDATALCDTATVSITVVAPNNPPAANDDTASTPEDTAVVIDVVANDTDVDGNLDPTTVSITAGPTHGGVTVNAVTGALTYTPTANYNGPDSVSYQVCDTAAACDTAVVSITVNAVDDAPVANDDSAGTPEDTAVVIPVVANDTDIDGNLDPSTVTIAAGPTHGGVTVNPVTGAITYSPAANYNGADSFTYQVCDTTALCDTATVTLTVSSVDDTPIANDDIATTPEDTAVVVDALANDTDGDSNLAPITITIPVPPAHGGVSVNLLTGAITYTPTANYNGADSFTYQVCDTTMPVALCDTATVSLTVTAADDAPVANGDFAATPEDTAVVVDVVSNDTDGDGNLDPTSVVVVGSPTHGTAVVDPVTGAITYTPAANYNGPDSLVYQVCDTTALCDTATLTLIVAGANDPPIVLGDIVLAADGVPVDVDVLANDSDVDGTIDPTTVSIVSGPSHGIVTVDPVSGTMTYTATLGYSGGDAFTYSVCDDAGACGTATVTISVNGAPLAVDDSVGVLAGMATTVDVLANDSDPDGTLDSTSVSIVSGPVHGTVTVDPVDGTLDYTSDPAWFGPDQLTYRVCDTGTPALCATATLSLLVNAPPQATDDSARTVRGIAVSIDVLANDSDPDGTLDATSVSIVSGTAHGTLSVNPVSGRVSYLPEAGFYGDDAFTYRVCDTGSPSGCATAVASIHVNAPPNAGDDTAGTTTGEPVTIDVVANDNDPDGSVDPASVVITVAPTGGTVTVDPATGEITYTPDAGFHGTDTFTYQVCDTEVPPACDTATVRVGLPPTNTLAEFVGRTAGPGIAAAALLAGLVALAGLLAVPRRRRERARK
jgi:large repetitive protein